MKILGSLYLIAQLILAADVSVFSDQLDNGFQDWSWPGPIVLQAIETHSGATAIEFEPDNYSGVYVQSTTAFSGTNLEYVTIWLNGGNHGHQLLQIVVVYFDFTTSTVSVRGDLAIDDLLPGGLQPGTWTELTVALSDLGVSAGITFNGMYLMANTNADQEAVYVDDWIMIEREGPPPGPSVAVSINLASMGRTISPEIYGVNAFEPLSASAPPYPFIRWGGNSTSRYAWDIDARSVGFDWFYFSYPNGNDHPELLPDGSATDKLIDWIQTQSTELLLTVPTLGWVPRDRTQRWSYSIALYGNQAQNECSYFSEPPSWCNPDAGNGIDLLGNQITINDPNDASRPVNPDYIADWITHLHSRYGTAADSGIRMIALDNEPMLWNSTHADVHSAPVSYDELWNNTESYASLIKTADPDILIFGPAVWGWCAYFGSALDSASGGSCIDGPDRQSHGGVPLLEWYLQQNHAYETTFGTRLVDVLDFHYYPQNGTAFSGDDNQANSRFEALRSLWDPTYLDPTWIADTVQLIPRMRDIVDRNCPGMALSLSEYRFGNDGSITSALAHLEALAIFGREGLDYATRWVIPDSGSLVERAFMLMLNYDGQGKAVLGTHLDTSNANPTEIAAFAIRHPNQTVMVLLINKANQARTAEISWLDPVETHVSPVYGFATDTTVGLVGEAHITPTGFDLELPPWSARLVVLGSCAQTGLENMIPAWRTADPVFDIAPLNGDGIVDIRDFIEALKCGLRRL